MKVSVVLILPAVIAITLPLAAQTNAKDQALKLKTTRQDEVVVIGIQARTTADKEMSGQGIIGGMWQKFMQEGVLGKIPNKADQNVYAIYTDFSNKRFGEYSVVIGARVTDKSKVPAGMVAVTIPAGKYAVFQSEAGPAWQVIPAAWLKIADAEDKGSLGYTRTYVADFELYSGQSMDPQNMQAELYVGVK